MCKNDYLKRLFSSGATLHFVEQRSEEMGEMLLGLLLLLLMSVFHFFVFNFLLSLGFDEVVISLLAFATGVTHCTMCSV